MAGLYIHVPFCKTRCHYCDFFTGTDNTLKEKYIVALCAEMALRREYLSGEALKTIYFGGGTPSQLTSEDFEQVFDAINRYFSIAPDTEITMEANPDDLSEEYLKDLRKLPFNRLSIGIQSFNDKELQFLNRRHSAQKAIDAVHLAKEYGFGNISIDLMYGLPNQTLAIWEENLHKAIELGVQHISAYHLIYEEGTPLYKQLAEKKITPTEEDTSLSMFSLMIDKLKEAGFVHYEISNFAREGYISQHNSSYWTGEKYLGLGPAAHSYDGENRAWNIASLPLYVAGIEKGSPDSEVEVLDAHARYNDFILTGLRTMWGVNLERLKELFGDKMLDYCLQYADKHIRSDKAVIVGNHLVLTREGIFISDNIMSDLMYIS
ncbi:radical SAM family heme chaperone HemW [Dysgonomonas sp. 25]|uniref:radical SAM family heme chaperone HemW n=1 Tax=Dysgonomonas sp. 25 TaxID=2302933 RepID=UPI0013CFB07D|nr:radical SAM family heme chaperone HemW [Dysgonomonas sp. 25]NDV70346.1 radical SAM family heme chaperone HemW [Dysgonomonas sp. 25]